MPLRSPRATDGEPATAKRKLNAEVLWDLFDPAAYIDHNYIFLRPDDAKILEIVRRHFSDHFDKTPKKPSQPVLGIDVGAGANLYPALSMLPWCDEITLFERSAANAGYLRDQRASYDENWNQFWDVLARDEAYGELTRDPRERFAEVVRVEQGNLFDLDDHRGRWSIGTMFFVAESMSTSRREFETGVERFMRALAPGAPFAAAFMEGSLGYKVGQQTFPACSVGETEVRDSLGPYAEGKVDITLIGMPGGALRPGYEGMIVACGRRSTEQ